MKRTSNDNILKIYIFVFIPTTKKHRLIEKSKFSLCISYVIMTSSVLHILFNCGLCEPRLSDFHSGSEVVNPFTTRYDNAVHVFMIVSSVQYTCLMI